MQLNLALNYKTQGSGQPIILLHGLFGSLANLGIVARAFADTHQVIQIDLRNHGLSPWSDEMDYALMAQDVLTLIDKLSLNNIILIGHSMGGKVAMQLTHLAEEFIAQTVILDIAPVNYVSDSHTNVFKAINACNAEQVKDKKSLHTIMQNYLPELTIQFLLKSYQSEHWLFNFNVIEAHYADIRGWQELPTYFNPVLFIKGSDSNYIRDEYQTDILRQFPYGVIEIVDGAGHNVHAENPTRVISLIKNWIT